MSCSSQETVTALSSLMRSASSADKPAAETMEWVRFPSRKISDPSTDNASTRWMRSYPAAGAGPDSGSGHHGNGNTWAELSISSRLIVRDASAFDPKWTEKDIYFRKWTRTSRDAGRHDLLHLCKSSRHAVGMGTYRVDGPRSAAMCNVPSAYTPSALPS